MWSNYKIIEVGGFQMKAGDGSDKANLVYLSLYSLFTVGLDFDYIADQITWKYIY